MCVLCQMPDMVGRGLSMAVNHANQSAVVLEKLRLKTS